MCMCIYVYMYICMPRCLPHFLQQVALDEQCRPSTAVTLDVVKEAEG